MISVSLGKTLKQARDEWEKEFILLRLRDYDGNITRTAYSLGLDRRHFYRKLEFHGIRITC